MTKLHASTKVNYRVGCGAMCRFHNPRRDILAHIALQTAFKAMAAWFGKPMDAVRADILVCVSVFHEGESPKNVFAFVSAHSADSGIHVAERVFVLLQAVNSDDVQGYQGLKLKLVTHRFVQSQRRLPSPINRGVHGSLVHILGDDFCKAIVHGGSEHIDITGSEVLTRIIVRVMDYDDVSLSTVTLKGTSCWQQEVNVEQLAKPSAELQPVAGGPAKGQQNPKAVDN